MPALVILLAVAVAGVVSLASANEAMSTVDALLGWVTWVFATAATGAVLVLLARVVSPNGRLVPAGLLLVSAIAWFPVGATWSDGCNRHRGVIPLWSAAAPGQVAASSLLLSYFDESTLKACGARAATPAAADAAGAVRGPGRLLARPLVYRDRAPNERRSHAGRSGVRPNGTASGRRPTPVACVARRA